MDYIIFEMHYSEWKRDLLSHPSYQMKLSPIHIDILKTKKILHTCLKRENEKLKDLQLSLICKFNEMIIFLAILGSLELQVRTDEKNISDKV